MQRILLILTIVLFGGLTAAALVQDGIIGILKPHFQSFGGGQVLADLVISLTLFIVWMRGDAKKNGRNAWLWIAITLLTGSFGPLFYLLTRRSARS